MSRISCGYSPESNASRIDINFEYTSRNFIQQAGVIPVEYSDTIITSADTVLFPPQLIQRLLKVKFLEAKGFDSQKLKITFGSHLTVGQEKTIQRLFCQWVADFEEFLTLMVFITRQIAILVELDNGNSSVKRGGKQSAEGLSIPSSMQGINSVTSLALMNAAECVYTYNLVAQDLGMVVRRGFEEWAKGWSGGIAKTVIPFEGHQTSHDKLFVSNNEGIWDCTAEGEIAPTKVLTWATQTGEAGYCSQQVFTNDGNDMFILLCDAVNGYHVYTQTTNTWAKVTLGTGAGQVSGIDPTNFNFVMIWKTVFGLLKRILPIVGI